MGYPVNDIIAYTVTHFHGFCLHSGACMIISVACMWQTVHVGAL